VSFAILSTKHNFLDAQQNHLGFLAFLIRKKPAACSKLCAYTWHFFFPAVLDVKNHFHFYKL
jgi:hypothetical protein